MISDNKLKHSIGVARKCALLAQQKGMQEDEQDACFVMGFLHDIGYEYNPTTSHPNTSYKLVRNAMRYHYEILRAIKDHGTKYKGLNQFDIILNEADLSIDYQGNTVSFDTRLQQIADYHGLDSEHYQHALQMIQALNNTTECSDTFYPMMPITKNPSSDSKS